MYLLCPEFTDEDVAAQSITFFVDGFETSATALSFAMYELAVNTDCQERLRTEVDKVLLKYNGEMSYQMLHELTYTDKVLAGKKCLSLERLSIEIAENYVNDVNHDLL